MAERLGLVITALGNGLALEKLADPDAVPDTLYGDMLALIFRRSAHSHARRRQQHRKELRMTESASTVPTDATPGPAAGLELRKANLNDVHQLQSTLAEAFYDDPIFSWMIPDEPSRLARLRRFFATELRHAALTRGCVWTSSDLSGAALDHAAWRVGAALHARS